MVQDLQGAADAYAAVLALPDAAPADRLAAVSNRAACSLAQHNYSSAVSDCSLAFGLLVQEEVQADPDIHTWLQSSQGGVVQPVKI